MPRKIIVYFDRNFVSINGCMDATPSDKGFALTHELFLLDANLKVKLDTERKEEITNALIDDLLRELNMMPLSPLQIYPASDPRAPGWSFIQLITTSHINGHYFEASDTFSHIHLDIYSCKSYDWKKALRIFDKHFDLLDWKGNLIKRSANLRGRKTQKLSGNGTKIFSNPSESRTLNRAFAGIIRNKKIITQKALV